LKPGKRTEQGQFKGKRIGGKVLGLGEALDVGGEPATGRILQVALYPLSELGITRKKKKKKKKSHYIKNSILKRANGHQKLARDSQHSKGDIEREEMGSGWEGGD